jgi:sugar phosphate isomerase/epimerase
VASNLLYPGLTSLPPFGQAPDPLIAFGPAAAPRWFDNDAERLIAYLDLIQDSGGSAIECVLLPGPVSIGQRRVHVSDTLWPHIVREVGRRNMIVTLHWPLLPEFHFSAVANEPEAIANRARVILVSAADLDQDRIVLVVHGDSDNAERTRAQCLAILGSDSTGDRLEIAVELRSRSDADDQRWDRSLESIVETLAGWQEPHIGLCLDIANAWRNTGIVPSLDQGSLDLLRHVHLHDVRPDGNLHAPLSGSEIDWAPFLCDLRSSDWGGSVTLEIRYRYASENGEPWSVLTDSLRRIHDVLDTGADATQCR